MQTKILTNKIKLTLASILFCLGLVSFAVITTASVAAVSTDLHSNVCGGANLSLTPAGEDAEGNAGCTQDSHSTPLTNTIARIVEILSVIVGIVAVIMIIWGGFKFITSNGDSGNITSARNTIIYALIGLVIVALAQIIVRFVLTKTPS